MIKGSARADPLITVSGRVPDIRESYAAATVFAAPMQIGTGLQNKLLEAMAMRMPCVTSALANNAVGAVPNESILIGTEPADYAGHILRLLGDVEECERIAGNGFRFVRSTFDWGRNAEALDKLIASAHTSAPPVPAV